MRKERAYAEIYGDLDQEVVNLFRCLRCPEKGEQLKHALHLTPYSRTEFDAAYEVSEDDVERTRRPVIRSFMGFGSDGAAGEYRTGFRASSNRSGSTPAADWRNYPAALDAMIDRLRGLMIECEDALSLMRRHDSPQTLHCVDPPYMLNLRFRVNRRKDGGGTYRHEMTAEHHEALLEFLCGLEGMAILCGYPSPDRERS